MNMYQCMGIVAFCTAVFAGVVTLLTLQGVHILVAVFAVYLVAVWTMLCMQRKARENFETRNTMKMHLPVRGSLGRGVQQVSDFRKTASVDSLFHER